MIALEETARQLVALPRMPRAKEEALAIGRTLIPQRPTLNMSRESADIPGALGTWMGAVRVVVLTLVMVALTAFASLVLLPAAVAAQAAEVEVARRLIEVRSKGVIQFKVASLYPLLYRLEARGWIHGRWVEKAGQRRRRYYRLTSWGRQILDAQRHTWRAFADAIARVTGVEHA